MRSVKARHQATTKPTRYVSVCLDVMDADHRVCANHQRDTFEAVRRRRHDVIHVAVVQMRVSLPVDGAKQEIENALKAPDDKTELEPENKLNSFQRKKDAILPYYGDGSNKTDDNELSAS